MSLSGRERINKHGAGRYRDGGYECECVRKIDKTLLYKMSIIIIINTHSKQFLPKCVNKNVIYIIVKSKVGGFAHGPRNRQQEKLNWMQPECVVCNVLYEEIPK